MNTKTGARTDLTLAQNGTKLSTAEEIGKQTENPQNHYAKGT